MNVVFNMLTQFVYLVSKMPGDMIAETTNAKLDRQLKRITEGQ